MGKIFGSMSLSPEVSAYCWEYLSRYLLFTVPILLMNNFTLYMIAAGKASLSLLCSVAGGVTISCWTTCLSPFSAGGSAGRRLPPAWGTPSQPSWACWCSPTGTACSILSGRSAGPKRSGEPSRTAALKWPPRWSTGIITLMFNWTMLKYVGEDGVAAITIISYVLAFAGSLYAGYGLRGGPHAQLLLRGTEP